MVLNPRFFSKKKEKKESMIFFLYEKVIKLPQILLQKVYKLTW